MSPARPHEAVLVASLLVVLTGAPGAEAACNATCRRDITRCMATQCGARVGREACRRRCKPAVIRTLAYALSECRRDAAGMEVGRQALRIRRGDREPISVLEFGPSEPIPDRQRICGAYGRSFLGTLSVLVFPLQRLGVSPDGSGVVFEVNDDFSLSRLTSLPPEQKGFFFVRSDGRERRYLGPASRDPSFRVGQGPIAALLSQGNVFTLSPPIPFSPNGRRIAFTDLGPGPAGEEAVQIVILDLATGQRTMTSVPSGSTPPPAGPGASPYFLTCCPAFIDNETVLFHTFTDPDGLNPEHNFAAFTVRIDGSKLKPVPTPVAQPGSHVVPTFGVTGRRTNLVRLAVPGTPVNHVPDPRVVFPITEVFLQDGKNLLQLTNFHRIDTFSAFLDTTGTRAFFLASANPRKEENPDGHCQVFSIDTLGRGLRQVTHFNSRMDRGAGDLAFGVPGCFHEQCGISYGYYRGVFQDPVTKAVVFDSGCDPFGANPYGWQVFSLRPDGLGLRQLTDAAGLTTNPDGSFRVEKPGPFAYSAALH